MRKLTTFTTIRNHDMKHQNPSTVEQALENVGLTSALLKTQYGKDIAAMKKAFRKAYQELAIRFHPDKVAADTADKRKEAEEMFKLVNQGYLFLVDDANAADVARVLGGQATAAAAGVSVPSTVNAPSVQMDRRITYASGTAGTLTELVINDPMKNAIFAFHFASTRRSAVLPGSGDKALQSILVSALPGIIDLSRRMRISSNGATGYSGYKIAAMGADAVLIRDFLEVIAADYVEKFRREAHSPIKITADEARRIAAASGVHADTGPDAISIHVSRILREEFTANVHTDAMSGGGYLVFVRTSIRSLDPLFAVLGRSSIADVPARVVVRAEEYRPAVLEIAVTPHADQAKEAVRKFFDGYSFGSRSFWRGKDTLNITLTEIIDHALGKNSTGRFIASHTGADTKERLEKVFRVNFTHLSSLASDDDKSIYVLNQIQGMPRPAAGHDRSLVAYQAA